MLNDNARSEYESDSDGFVYPRYDGRSLSNVPNTVLRWFGIKADGTLDESLYESVLKGRTPKRVVMIFIDGFGYLQWKRYYKSFSVMKKLTERGLVTPITTVFPSTTAAAVTSTQTGTAPIKHLCLEWYIYNRKVDSTIATLPFKRIGSGTFDSLQGEGLTADDLFHGEAIYKRLGDAGVESLWFGQKDYTDSTYSSKAYAGTKVMPYHGITDLFVSVRKTLKEKKGRAFLNVYLSDLDSMEHTFGPYTEQYEAQLSVIMHLLDTELLGKLTRQDVEDALVMVVADHGHVKVDPQKTIYLNDYADLMGMFEVSGNGKPISPVGSPRDVFLHIKPERLEEAQSYLAGALKGKARIVKTSELVDKGIFGNGKAGKEFYDRIGNLAVLPYGSKTVWWAYSEEEYKLYGMHGGLSEEEMLIPFAVSWLSDLI